MLVNTSSISSTQLAHYSYGMTKKGNKLMSTTTPIYLATDFYKLSHREQYPEGTTVVYSTLTPRSNKYAPWSNEIVVFGLQYFIKEYLINRFNNK